VCRRQFEAYLEKVFDLSARVTAMEEGRQSPRHGWRKVFDAVFLGAALQIRHLHRVEAECRQGVLQQRIGKLSEDTMAYALQRQDPAAVFALGCEVAHRSKRNGLLHSSWARGQIVAAVDGIEICSSYVRCCDACMEREVEHKVDGELRKDIQYYHRIVAAVVVSSEFPVPLGIRFQKNGEDEVGCAVELLRDLHGQLGQRFLDVLVADALFLKTPFVKIVEHLGWDWVINLKENQPELLAEAQRLTSGEPTLTQSEQREELRLWHLPEVYWPAADRSVRVVKTIRTQKRNRVRVQRTENPEATIRKKKTKELFQQDGTNYYASNLELGSIPPTFISQLGRSRWVIDSDAFQTLTTQAHLKSPSVHQDAALVVLTMIRVLAYTLSLVFYHRQVVSHARQAPPTFTEMARLLAYLFFSPRIDSS
jgi:hypothetical protein